MLKQVNGKWALVSKKTQRPLAYYRGEGKPSDEWVTKQERRIQFFKHGFSESLFEAAYAGNIGIMELIKFHKSANEQQKKKLESHIKNKNNKDAWELVKSVTGTKLHKSVSENIDPDILPRSGAGQDGTKELVKNYLKATPGQKKELISFKDYRK